MPGEIVSIAPAAEIFRVARRGGDPFAPPPWDKAGADGTFGNRFDDPSAERGLGTSERFRSIYCATTAMGSFGETLARFRPSIQLLARLREIDEEEPLISTICAMPPAQGCLPGYPTFRGSTRNGSAGRSLQTA